MQEKLIATNQGNYINVTQHAAMRMQQRGIAVESLSQVLAYGRRIHAKGVLFRVVGHKEVARFATRGVDLRHVQGVHALVGSDGAVVTVYRSSDLHAIQAPKGYGSKKHQPKLH